MELERIEFKNAIIWKRKSVKKLNFETARYNVAEYTYSDRKNLSLEIDSTIEGLVRKHKLYKTVFESPNGRYLCTSSMMNGFVANPFNVDANAVSYISCFIENFLREQDLMLVGWSIHDNMNGTYQIDIHAVDRDYEEDHCVPNVLFLCDKGVTWVDEKSQEYFGIPEGYFNWVLTDIVKVVNSLQGIGVPIDLFEVCIAGTKYSEEGFNNKDGEVDSYICSGEIGNFRNKEYLLNGISVITSYNGFDRFEDELYGKYAVVVVQ